MLSFNPIVDQPYTSYELPPVGRSIWEQVPNTTFDEFMHIIPHDLLSYYLLWAPLAMYNPP
jgi:hypothetical protein